MISGAVFLWSESRVHPHVCPPPAASLVPGSALFTDWLVLPGGDTAISSGKAAGIQN